MSGKVVIMFDGASKDHLDAAKFLDGLKIKACFGAVLGRENEPGRLTKTDLLSLAKNGHFVLNNSMNYVWSGEGEYKPQLKDFNRTELTDDFRHARITLNEMGLHGDYLSVPFGTLGTNGFEHIRSLLDEFTWIRLTDGVELPIGLGGWIQHSGEHLYPRDFTSNLIGVSAAAKAKTPSKIQRTLIYAAKQEALAIIAYQGVTHLYGSGSDIKWDNFAADMTVLHKLCQDGRLSVVLPPAISGKGNK